MEYEKIPVESVPAPAKSTPRDTQDVLDMLSAIQPGEAVRITPPPGKSVKGLRIGISRIISGRKLSGYEVSGDETHVYIKRARK